jgi:hypothetical protein
MAHPAEVAGVAVPARKTWHARTRSDVDTQRVRSWQRRLTADEIALCEAALADRLTLHGYELSGAPTPPRGELLRYRRAAVPHRLAPAWRTVKHAADRMIPQLPTAIVPGTIVPQRTPTTPKPVNGG